MLQEHEHIVLLARQYPSAFKRGKHLFNTGKACRKRATGSTPYTERALYKRLLELLSCFLFADATCMSQGFV